MISAFAIVLLVTPLSFQYSFSQETSNNNENWVGTINITPKIQQLLQSEAKISLIDAINAAIKAVGPNTTSDAASLVISKGFLVYHVLVTDSNFQMHRIIIDAGNGAVLSDQPFTIPTPTQPTPPSPTGPQTQQTQQGNQTQ